MLKRSECRCPCHTNDAIQHIAPCCIPDEWVTLTPAKPVIEHSDAYYDFERNGRRVHDEVLSPVTVREDCKCECHSGGEPHAFPCCRAHKGSCCAFDDDGDGNCHIHSAPGVFRNEAFNAAFGQLTAPVCPCACHKAPILATTCGTQTNMLHEACC